MPIAARPRPISSASSKRRLRRSRWAATASAKLSARPGADLDLGGDQLARRRVGQHLVRPTGGVELLEAVLELEAGGSRIANSSSRPIVKSVEDSNLSRARSRSRADIKNRASPVAQSDRPRCLRARRSSLGQVEVERVEQVDRRAGGVDGHLRRHLEQLLGVVEDDLDAGLDQPVGDPPARRRRARRGRRRRSPARRRPTPAQRNRAP